MKVIFLDIDGVLATRDSYLESNPTSLDVPFAKSAVQQLNWLIEKSGAFVVVSSSWRHGKGILGMQLLFDRQGVNCWVVGCTPSLEEVGRGEEIKSWLKVHQDAKPGFEVGEFVILDDDKHDIEPIFPHNFVWIQEGMRKGLEVKHVRQALKILQREDRKCK